MSNRNDNKYASLLANTGETSGNIDDLEILWLKSIGATADQINRAWHQVFLLNGATSANWDTAAQEFLVALGAPSEHVSDNWTWFWVTNGGVII